MKKILSVILLSAPFCLQAQPGTLDSSFGINGKVITNFGINTSPEIYRAVLQTDNKIIETGTYNSANVNQPFGFLAVRYTADGALDYDYGDSGKAVVEFSFEDYADARTGAIQADDKVLLAGYGWYNYFHPVYSGVIARLNTDGSLDSSFGTNGAIQTTINGSGNYTAITVQADNKIVAIGGVGSAGNSSSLIARFLSNGTLDKTFGDNGYVFPDNNFGLFSCKIQADGKIVVGGYYHLGDFGFRKFCVQRYLSSGVIDKSFGDSGTVITAYGGDESLIADLAFQSDGKIVVTGETITYASGENNFATARYNIDGSLDSTFGRYGKTTTIFPNSTSSANSIVILKDDKIILGGDEANEIASFGLARLTASGIPDVAFGENGLVTTDFGSTSNIKSVLLQTTGKIVAAGILETSATLNCALTRYNNDDATKQQQIISKIRRWLQHRNGIVWDNAKSGVNSYAVQRSGDTKNWVTVYRSPLTANNTYSDPAPLSGTNYYRLQTTSVDGAVSNSNIIAVTADDALNIVISPNPAKSVLNIQGLPFNQNIKLTVVDFSGNTAISQQLPANSNTSYNINISSLHPGNYLLKIEMKDEVVTKKFVKE